MSFFHEPGRLIGHALLDATIAATADGSLDERGGAADLALEILGGIDDAVPVTVDGAPDDSNIEVSVDLSNLVGMALVLVMNLARELADARGVDVEVVVAELREHLDVE